MSVISRKINARDRYQQAFFAGTIKGGGKTKGNGYGRNVPDRGDLCGLHVQGLLAEEKSKKSML